MKTLQLIVLVSVCMLLCSITGYGQPPCAPASLPHPTIVSSFTADSSCLDHHQGDPNGSAGRKECIAACESSYTTYCVLNNPPNTYTCSEDYRSEEHTSELQSHSFM